MPYVSPAQANSSSRAIYMSPPGSPDVFNSEAAGLPPARRRSHSAPPPALPRPALPRSPRLHPADRIGNAGMDMLSRGLGALGLGRSIEQTESLTGSGLPNPDGKTNPDMPKVQMAEFIRYLDKVRLLPPEERMGHLHKLANAVPVIASETNKLKAVQALCFAGDRLTFEDMPPEKAWEPAELAVRALNDASDHFELMAQSVSGGLVQRAEIERFGRLGRNFESLARIADTMVQAARQEEGGGILDPITAGNMVQLAGSPDHQSA